MSQLTLQLKDGRSSFQPGEMLHGEASWDCKLAPAMAEVRLCWFTNGAAVPEACCVQRVVLERPAASERRPFSFPLPEGPCSFLGALAALSWAVELILRPGEDCLRRTFVLGPEGNVIVLSGESSLEEADEDEPDFAD